MPSSGTRRGERARRGASRGGGPALLTLNYYTCPMLCPLTLRSLLGSVERMKGIDLGRDFRIVTVSINPEDTPAIASARAGEIYAEMKGTDDPAARWPFLLGDAGAVGALTGAVGFRYRRGGDRVAPPRGGGEAASRTTVQVDALFLFITLVSLFFFLLVEGLLIYFAIKYRRKKGAEPAATPDIRGNLLLESIWIVIPSLVVASFFYYGYRVFRDIRTPSPGATDIHAVGRQWLFEFRYPDGRSSINELRVPAGRPVKLILTSDDVIHSFFVPDYRLKQDMVPGRYTTLYLHPDKAGTYPILCAEYCGVSHSTMRAELIVMEPDAYAAWRGKKKEPRGLPLAERGKALAEKSGCLGCHALEGKEKFGPNFGKVFGRKVLLADGTSVPADEAYLRAPG